MQIKMHLPVFASAWMQSKLLHIKHLPQTILGHLYHLPYWRFLLDPIRISMFFAPLGFLRCPGTPSFLIITPKVCITFHPFHHVNRKWCGTYFKCSYDNVQVKHTLLGLCPPWSPAPNWALIFSTR